MWILLLLVLIIFYKPIFEFMGKVFAVACGSLLICGAFVFGCIKIIMNVFGSRK